MAVALHVLGALMGFCTLAACACLRAGAESERAMEDAFAEASGEGR